jgi:hypothetical protein
MPAARRFPPPWIIEDANIACFIVRDATGQALAYIYFEEEPGRAVSSAHLSLVNWANRINRAIASCASISLISEAMPCAASSRQ